MRTGTREARKRKDAIAFVVVLVPLSSTNKTQNVRCQVTSITVTQYFHHSLDGKVNIVLIDERHSKSQPIITQFLGLSEIGFSLNLYCPFQSEQYVHFHDITRGQ